MPDAARTRTARRADAWPGLLMAACLALAVQLGIGTAAAADLPRPEGPVILTVSGQIAHANAGGRAEFDLEMLRRLGTHGFTTATIWTEGTSRYEGVPLRAVLDRVGASGGTITAVALNDYSVSFPLAEVTAEAPMLAFLRDGAPMSVRDKGPLWVLYPFDSDPAWRSEQTYSRSVWQLDRLRIGD